MEIMDLQELREFYLAQFAAVRHIAPAAAAPGAPNLVMGLAANLGKADVELFVNSLRRSGYQDEIALFVTKVDPELQAYARRNAVMLVRSSSMLHSHWNAALMRFLFYYDFLMSQLAAGRAYAKVLMSDVTDVVFQLNPFGLATPDRLTVFSEGGVTIGECYHNSLWIKSAFGDEALERLGGKEIFCSGTTMGPTLAVLEYLLKVMLGATNADPASFPLAGIDQGIHNYLIHEGWLPNCQRSANGEIILTMYYYLYEAKVFYTDPQGRLCDSSGRVMPVLHQYNRAANLKAHIRRTYADETARSRPATEDVLAVA